jgi:hypothetical protein
LDRRPVSIAIEGDLALGQSYIPEAQQLLFKLRAQMEPGGIATSRAYMELPDGAYAYAISAMGIEAVRIVVGGGASNQLYEVPPKREPDFVSGVMIDGLLAGNSNDTAQVMKSFIPTVKTGQFHGIPAGVPGDSRRLAVKVNSDLGDTDRFAQCAVLKPTMYSGSMKEVVQALLGFGRQPRVSIYERENKKQYTTVEAESLNAPLNKPTRYESAVAINGLQVIYDYRFYRTHGITWATDGKPWLVEISTNKGVLAMPLPLHESTTTAKFRAKLVRMGDEDGIRLLDRFGGFPTGEGFPIGAEAQESAIRAGIVLQLVKKDGMQPFYRHTSYSSAMGWAFNASGSEAHNTGYRFESDHVQRGVHYCVVLRIGSSNESEPIKATAAVIQMVRSDAINLGVKATVLIKKAARLQADQVASVLRARQEGGVAAGIAALDALTLNPIASGSASLSMVAEGNIWWPSIKGPQIKFHEPIIGYLLSHDMRPAVPTASVDCDTTMHVFFKGDELKVCKYFHRGNQLVPDINDSDEEDCMYVGSWTTTTETGRAIPSMFYTTDYDDREEVGGIRTVKKTTGRDLGYTSCQYGDNPANLRQAFMTRVKTFRMFTTIKVRAGFHRQTAIAAPEGIREAYYYAKFDYAQGEATTEIMNYKTLEDPYSYETWRNFYDAGRPHPAGCGAVSRRTVYRELYDKSPCSDLAESGPWASPCDDAESMAYHVNLPAGFDSTVLNSYPAKLNVRLVCCSDRTPMETRAIIVNDQYYNGGFWFIPSPDPDSDNVAFIHATHNALGDGDSLKYNPNINDTESLVVGAPNYPQMATKPITFIGVINGV